MVSDTAAAAVSRRRVKVTLADVAEPVAGAYDAMMEILIAAAQHADQLEGVAGPGSVGQMHSSVTPGMRIWQQVLGSEQGRQLPQAMMDVGSMLCAALPTRFGCNEPSCCCLDKPSELQLAEGKGTKCSGRRVARYCSSAHQRLHWKQHKPACKAIAAAAKAASGALEPASRQRKS